MKVRLLQSLAVTCCTLSICLGERRLGAESRTRAKEPAKFEPNTDDIPEEFESRIGFKKGERGDEVYDRLMAVSHNAFLEETKRLKKDKINVKDYKGNSRFKDQVRKARKEAKAGLIKNAKERNMSGFNKEIDDDTLSYEEFMEVASREYGYIKRSADLTFEKMGSNMSKARRMEAAQDPTRRLNADENKCTALSTADGTAGHPISNVKVGVTVSFLIFTGGAAFGIDFEGTTDRLMFVLSFSEGGFALEVGVFASITLYTNLGVNVNNLTPQPGPTFSSSSVSIGSSVGTIADSAKQVFKKMDDVLPDMGPLDISVGSSLTGTIDFTISFSYGANLQLTPLASVIVPLSSTTYEWGTYLSSGKECEGGRDTDGLVGCYNQIPTGSTYRFVQMSSVTPENCREKCRDTPFFFIVKGNECWCSRSFGNSDPVQLSECSYTCNGDADLLCGGVEKALVYVTGPQVLIDKSDMGNRYMTLKNDDIGNTNEIVTQEYHSRGSQLLTILPSLSGKVEIRPVYPGTSCFDATSYDDIIIYRCHQGVNQEWLFKPHDKYRTYIVSQGEEIDLENGSNQIGANLHMRPHIKAPNARWDVYTMEEDEYEMSVDGNDYFYHVGCFKDQSERDLPVYKGIVSGTDDDRIDDCSELCIYYMFFGVQNSNECWCGQSYGRYGKAKKTDCNTCYSSSNPNVKCGGPWRNSIYVQENNSRFNSRIPLSDYSIDINPVTVGTRAKLWKSNSGSKQLFELESEGNGFILMIPEEDQDLCLGDIDDVPKLGECEKMGIERHWTALNIGSGDAQLINRKTSRSIDMGNGFYSGSLLKVVKGGVHNNRRFRTEMRET